MTDYHHVTVKIVNDYGAVFTLECTAPVGAECRLACDDGCESWEVDDYDWYGKPFHRADGSGSHRMGDQGRCMVLDWLNDDPVGRHEGVVTLGRFPFTYRWQDDGYLFTIEGGSATGNGAGRGPAVVSQPPTHYPPVTTVHEGTDPWQT